MSFDPGGKALGKPWTAVFLHRLLFACGRKKAHHLHGQLEPLKVMLQVLSFNGETVLQEAEPDCYQPWIHWEP